MVIQTGIILPCFGVAFGLSRLVDRISQRRMSHLVRGLFTFAVGFVLFEVVALTLVVIVCRLPGCDL